MPEIPESGWAEGSADYMNKSLIFLPLILIGSAFIRIPAISSKTAIRQEITQSKSSTSSQEIKPVKTQINAKYNEEQIKNYILSQAKAENVSTTIISWIVQHESQWGQKMVGDDGNSRGIWMISRIWHPEVSQQCAMDMKCSTQFSLNLIKKGQADQWSTWRLRCVLYKDQNPPGCV